MMMRANGWLPAAAAVVAGTLIAGAAHADTASAKIAVDAAKSQGLVGEQSDGFLGLVTGSADAAVKAAVAEINAAIDGAKTLVWNGPLGAFELAPFDAATVAAAKHAAARTKDGQLVSVAGGGDTVAALNHAGAGQDFTYVSTAGGAFLEWLEGKALPGVEALRAKG